MTKSGNNKKVLISPRDYVINFIHRKYPMEIFEKGHLTIPKTDYARSKTIGECGILQLFG
jgi:hypothetical protein